MNMIASRLVEGPDFMCRTCLGNARKIDGRACVQVQLADDKLNLGGSFFYLAECICLGVGYELVAIEKCFSEWGKF